MTGQKGPTLAAVRGGADGLAAINTVLCVIGVNLETLRPMPTVEGYSVPGGYSGRAVLPIALRLASGAWALLRTHAPELIHPLGRSVEQSL